MSALPNPLQELAEKIAAELYTSYGYRQEATDKILPILTESIGTLLQAERAAVIAQADAAFDSYEGSKLLGAANNVREAIKALATPEAASALSAVVQRETAQLRELLREAAQDRHDLTQKWEGKYGPKGSRTACDSDGFDTCPAELCVKVRAALK